MYCSPMRFPGTSPGVHALERNDVVRLDAVDTLAEMCNYSNANERKHVYGLTQENGRDAR